MKDGEIMLDPSWGGERDEAQEGGEDVEVEEVAGDHL